MFDLFQEHIRANDINVVEVALMLLTNHELLLNYITLGIFNAFEHILGQGRLTRRL